MEQNTITFKDYIDIIKRRKWALLFPFFFISGVACVIAYRLPSVYKSTATILIEDQMLPEDYVISSGSSYAENRIENIKQRIMSTTQLLEIIDRLGLYPDMRDKSTTTTIVSRMRDDIRIEPISAELKDRRTGHSNAATIAFTISYVGNDRPEIIHDVANLLTTLFLKENLEVRKRQAHGASTFLDDEKNKLKTYLVKMESKIASFKEKHLNELPDVLQINVQVLGDIERNIDQINEQLRNLRETEGRLEVNISQLSSMEESEKQKRINELKLQLTHLRTTYSNRYPDVIKLRNEILKLEKSNRLINKTDRDLHNNSSYVVLASQLNTTKSEIESLKKQIADLVKQKEVYQRRIQATPRIEEEYLNLISERRNIQKKYDDLAMKALESKVAQGLENAQKGGRFSLIEPAQLPEKPYKPNRMAVVLIGMLLGIGSGLGIASLMEFADQSVRTPEDLGKISDFPVLSEIPVLSTPMHLKQIEYTKLFLINGPLIVIVLIIGVCSYMLFDIEVLWTALLEKFQG